MTIIELSKTINANTWERKSNIPADTTGPFDNDNASSVFCILACCRLTYRWHT